jgi:hypothetical protein
VPLGKGWFGTTIKMSSAGEPRQNEEYLEWTERVTLPDQLFDRTVWKTEGDWAALPRPKSLWKSRKP